MSLRFFIGPDGVSLAKRYALVTVLRLLWILINSFAPSPSVILPLPYYWQLATIWGLPDAILAMMQLGLVFGLARFGARRFRPDLVTRWKILDDTYLLAKIGHRRTSRSSFGTIVLLCLLVVFTCCFVPWCFLVYGRGIAMGFGPYVTFSGGPWILLGVALSALGMLYGKGFVSKAKATVGSLFGVNYLAPDHWLAQRVASKAQALGLTPPAVGVINVTNAFAIGTHNDAAVVIGLPLAEALSPDELDAVIGHELGHILSNDMYRMQFAEGFQTMLGHVLGFVTTIGVRFAARYGRNAASVGGSLGILARRTLFVGSELVVKGISRSREFYADAIGASLTSPEAMISALQKLHNLPAKPTRLESQYGYLMFRGSKLGVMFSTHPTLEKRIKALKTGTHLLPGLKM